jgi:lipopolysaccharide export system protein LptA
MIPEFWIRLEFMQEITKRRAMAIGLRSRVPLLARIIALVLLAAGIAFVGISYYRLRNNTPFRLKSETPELSKEVIGVIEGYEQRVTKGDKLYLHLRASRDTTFSDNHHELENVNLAIYPPTGDKPDQITANRAIYDPRTSIISFLGNVKTETRDGLKVTTEALSYNQNSELAQSDVLINFSHENVEGHAVGAVLESKAKKLELKKDVEITVSPQVVNADAKSSSRTQPVKIRSGKALFEQDSMKLVFWDGATAEQAGAIMSGDTLSGFLNKDKKLERVEVRGNSYLRSMDPGKAAEVHAVDMDFFFDGNQRLVRAVGTRDIRARSLDADADVEMTAPNWIEVLFEVQADRSQLKQMRTSGRTVVNLSAPKSKANDPRAANKRLSADAVNLIWRTGGQDLQQAEAIGNAELFVDPVAKNAASDKKTLTAPRFDCDFYEQGNLARNFVASGGAKALIEAVYPSDNRAARTLTAQKISTAFVKDTQDVERIDAQGDAKFNQADRNGTAATVSYTAADETVRLRGGEPTVWDSRGRTKATELDSDLHNDVSYSRGKTATTYYNQEQTNGATPFTKVKSPVYISSERAEFHRYSGVAIYSGNARAWQDDNFVRGDTLKLYINDKRMEVNGHVQSALYNAKRRTQGGAASVIPVFATANSMVYSDADRVLHYEDNVDIKQGTDRITSGVADVYMTGETNDVEKTVAQRNVVLTQPNRKGTGDWIQYTTADEVAILKGDPARVEDAEKGSTEGARLTVNIREGRVVADDTKGALSPGRVRSTHKVNKP